VVLGFFVVVGFLLVECFLEKLSFSKLQRVFEHFFEILYCFRTVFGLNLTVSLLVSESFSPPARLRYFETVRNWT
jgi:hypothetical protein